MRKLLLAATALPIALLALPAGAATPGSGELSAERPKVAWQGGADVANPVGCTGSTDKSCDHFKLVVTPEAGKDVQVSIDVPEDADWDLYVYGPDGKEVAQGQGGFLGEDETATFRVTAKGTYEVRVQPYAVVPGGADYKGVATFVPAGAAGGQPVDREIDCPAEEVPHTFAPGLTEQPDDGSDISYDIAVLLDGVSQAAVEDLFKRSQPAYNAHGIVLRAVSFATVTVPGTTTADSTDTIDFARNHFGGGAPAGSDAVYLATKKDLTDEALGSAVAGQVACVGGVESAATAIAVGEVKPEDPFVLGPLGLDNHISLKVFAHELGHLLGAHHHYGNCVEGVGVDDVRGDTAPCTLMFNVANYQSMTFSTFNGGVIRGHANDFAR